jgi:hypothetical protein
MSIAAKRKDEPIKVNQFITDMKGNKMAAVIDIAELKRIEAVLDLIPPSEAWLFKNKKALESVQKGLKQAARGRISKLNLEEL